MIEKVPELMTTNCLTRYSQNKTDVAIRWDYVAEPQSQA
jgi:hypothetical protein